MSDILAESQEQKVQAPLMSLLPALNWFLQRVTGIFLAVFLMTHVIVIHYISHGKISFDNIFSRINADPFWFTFYLFFIVSGIYHALNGVWSIVCDYDFLKKFRTLILMFLWLVGIAASVYAVFVLNGLISKVKDAVL